jgi:hypothetical protein
VRRRRRSVNARSTSSEPIAVGDEIIDGGVLYAVVRVEPPNSAMGFGHMWVSQGVGPEQHELPTVP